MSEGLEGELQGRRERPAAKAAEGRYAVTTTGKAGTLLVTALSYADRGWRVFPCHTIRDDACTCGKADCDSPAKHPLTEYGWRAIKEGDEADPALRFTMPDEQRQEFNHYVFLMNGVNCDLGTFTAYLSAMVGQLNLRLGWLITVALLIDCGDKWMEQRWSGIETALAETLTDGIAQYWRQVRAVEAVVEEAREEFGGENPCMPLIRSKLDEAKALLEEMHERLDELGVATELPEISDEDLMVPRGIMQHPERIYE